MTPAGGSESESAPVTREELIERCLSQRGVVLLYEGSDAQANAAAALEARAAVEEARALVEHFPKPVGAPASLRVIGAAERELERVTSFGLGVSPELATAPELVIVFGKLRRAGPVLAGAEITRAGLLAALALLGESCECGLDRSWMTGPRAPVAWDAPLARRAAELLGFDARSQLVLAEVRSILARGVSESEDRRALPLEERLLGYQEQLVQPAPAAQALERDVPAPAQEQPARAASSKLVLALAGLGLASLLGAALVLGARTRRGSA